MRRARTALPLAALAGLALAGPALAATGIDDVPATGDDAGVVRAEFDELGTVQLLLAPADRDLAPADAQAQGTRALGDPPLELRANVPTNGLWRARLDVVDTTTGARTPRYRREGTDDPGDRPLLDVRVPPAAPTGVAAMGAAGGKVLLTWRRGEEADLVGYRVAVDDGAAQALPLDGTCSGSACRSAVSASPGSHRFTVTAVRACPTCDGQQPLTASAGPVTAEATAATPSATPSPRATATTRPPSLSPQALSPGDAGSLFGSGLPTPSAAVAAPRVADAPLPDGTYAPTLGYADPEPGDDDAVLTERRAQGPTALDRALDTVHDEGVARGLAAGLVLLLGGAHLRRWLAAGA